MNQINSSDGWEFIPLSQFEAPRISASDEVRMWYSGLIDQIKKKPSHGASFVQTEELSKVPNFLLDRLLPNDEHTLVIEELENILTIWKDNRNKQSYTPVIVGSVDGSVNRLLRKFAKNAGWRVLGAPNESMLLSLDFETYLSYTDVPDNVPIVIPNLEKWFLRHHFGLNFLRDVIQWLRSQNKTCVIGCQSWAWRYLRKTMKIDTLFPYVLTISPKSPENLNSWLSHPNKPFNNIEFTFRCTVDGQPIFNGNGQPSQFVSRLAAHTRGQPWLARELWKESLLVHDHHHTASEEAMVASDNCTSFSIWVKPWEESEFLDLPNSLSNNDLRMLHTSLIHGGITEATLNELFSANPSNTSHQLSVLEHAGLMSQKEESWIVSPVKYPAIRRKLVQEGFLFDDL